MAGTLKHRLSNYRAVIEAARRAPPAAATASTGDLYGFGPQELLGIKLQGELILNTTASELHKQIYRAVKRVTDVAKVQVKEIFELTEPVGDEAGMVVRLVRGSAQFGLYSTMPTTEITLDTKEPGVSPIAIESVGVIEWRDELVWPKEV
jgi:hypothetical protein